MRGIFTRAWSTRSAREPRVGSGLDYHTQRDEWGTSAPRHSKSISRMLCLMFLPSETCDLVKKVRLAELLEDSVKYIEEKHPDTKKKSLEEWRAAVLKVIENIAASPEACCTFMHDIIVKVTMKSTPHPSLILR